MPPIKIIFEDDSILVLDKPPGLVVDKHSLPSKDGKSETSSGNTLEDWLESQAPRQRPARLPRMGIVHRLDKDTTGVLLVAKTQTALENLQAQFKDRTIKKEYLALAHGLVEKPGKVEGAIGRNPGNKEKFAIIEDGKEAVTEYSPMKNYQFTISTAEGGASYFQKIFNEFTKIQLRKLEKMNYNQFTLLSCKPRTGRTHQIRVHLKYIGHPIVSDEKYVGRKMNRLDKRWCPRMFLHAAKIGFKHPVTGIWMEVESKLPEDLKEVLWITFSYNLQ
ncbi:MAG: Pseudouridine synthase [Microgenomates group bacterium Gr01-1014_93]|nr:MAG: Pseudouridine synthase [Microgenomates group bacterium Gr01-1014_93]